MKALISTLEPRESGYRVAQVERDVDTFDVAHPLFWVDCPNDVVADKFWFDPTDNLIKPIPVPVIPVKPQPVSQGAQDL